MDQFSLYSLGLGMLAAAVLLLPQIRRIRSGASLSVPVLLLSIAVPAAAALIYPGVSTWRVDNVHAGLPRTTMSQDAAAPADSGVEPAESVASIVLSISIDERIDLAQLPPTAVLYLFARSGAAGPPVAVRRLAVGAIPGTLELTDEHAMLPGSSLADFEQLEFTARISLGGDVMARAGDYFGETSGSADAAAAVPLVIDTMVE